MASETTLQERFLQTLVSGNTPVTLFLANGVKLQGHILSFDNFALLLNRDKQVQLVYKHAIATIVPTGGKHEENLSW